MLPPHNTTPAVLTVPRWFLESLLERSGHWLKQTTLEGSDVVARETAARLIAHACCHCCKGDQEESALVSAVGSAFGKALHRFVGG